MGGEGGEGGVREAGARGIPSHPSSHTHTHTHCTTPIYKGLRGVDRWRDEPVRYPPLPLLSVKVLAVRREAEARVSRRFFKPAMSSLRLFTRWAPSTEEEGVRGWARVWAPLCSKAEALEGALPSSGWNMDRKV